MSSIKIFHWPHYHVVTSKIQIPALCAKSKANANIANISSLTKKAWYDMKCFVWQTVPVFTNIQTEQCKPTCVDLREANLSNKNSFMPSNVKKICALCLLKLISTF